LRLKRESERLKDEAAAQSGGESPQRIPVGAAWR
jgi:hypothetical protein